MEAAIQAPVTQFKTYAGRDGSPLNLSKEGFCDLVTTQLPSYIQACPHTGSLIAVPTLLGFRMRGRDAGALEILMSSQDENNDGELTFPEFWKLIGHLAGEKEGGLS